MILPAGLLVVGTYVPPPEAAAIRRLSEATSAYAMLSAERASLAAIQVLLFLLLGFLVLLAAVWVGLVMARRVRRPIAALAASARRVGAGDFDTPVDVEGGDEIAALSRAFNAMTRELRESRGELVRANEELVHTNRRLADERRRVATILAHLTPGSSPSRTGARCWSTYKHSFPHLFLIKKSVTFKRDYMEQSHLPWRQSLKA